MKKIDAIIIHCSATRTGQDLRAKDIDRMHKQRGFNQIGYNFVIDLDGTGRKRPVRFLLTVHIVIRKDLVNHLTISIRLVFAILEAWMQVESLLILVLQNKR